MEPTLIALGSIGVLGLLLAGLIWFLVRNAKREGAGEGANDTLERELDHAANARKNAENAARLGAADIRERLRDDFRD